MIAVDVAEGQRNDAPLALPALREAKASLGRIDEVLGDKGFDSDPIRRACLDELDALPVIPNRKNRTDPWPWDDAMKETYKERNRVERAFSKAKQYRRFATRYEKLKEVFLGLVRLVFGFIHVRSVARSRTVNTAYERRPLTGHWHAFFLPVDDDDDGQIDHVAVFAPMGFSPVELQAIDRLRRLRFGEVELAIVLVGLGEREDFARSRLLGPSMV